MEIHKKTTEELKKERSSPEEMKKLPRVPLSLLVDNVRSLDNVGLIFRLSECARLNHLYLTGYTGHPRTENDRRPASITERHEHRIRKTAVYAVPYQPWSYHTDPVILARTLKDQGQKILVLEQTNQSIAYNHLPPAHYPLPTTLIVGHEREGVRSELLALADTVIDIPIAGIGNSHNVTIAAGIVVYHLLEKTGKLT